MTRVLMFFVMAALLLGGCATPMQKLDPEAIARIKPKQTTRAEVEQLFGAPKNLISGSDGAKVAEYSIFRLSPPPINTVFARSMSVLYDNRDLVRDVVHTEVHKTIEETQIEPLLPPELVIKLGITLEKVNKRFGPPDFQTFTPEGGHVSEWYYTKVQRSHSAKNTFHRLIVITDDAGYVRNFRMAQSQGAR
ncbi:MAG: hypothetical protein JWM68_1444 [Verrucomicrobiales bacterium]|nr:hypothetical protein [Verrucomicrobiales bacterium]